jgi:hypothetical protein
MEDFWILSTSLLLSVRLDADQDVWYMRNGRDKACGDALFAGVEIRPPIAIMRGRKKDCMLCIEI